MRCSSEPVESLVTLVRSAIGTRDFLHARRVHDRVVASGHGGDRFLCNSIMEMYGRCGRAEDARRVFDGLASRRNHYSWNLLLQAYVWNGRRDAAWEVFGVMPRRDGYAWNSMLDICLQSGDVHTGRCLFRDMPEKHQVSYNLMLKSYVQMGWLEHAREMFQRAPCLNLVSWTTVLAAYAENGHLDQSREYFRRMPLQDIVSCSTMIQAFGLGGCVEEARETFESMSERDIVSWTCLLVAFAQNSHFLDAEKSFQRMPKHCAVSHTAMLSTYARRGDLHRAWLVFNCIPALDNAAWNAMIGGYAHSGHTGEYALSGHLQCLELVSCMELEGFVADHVTFTSVLCSCSHLGLVDDAREQFRSMVLDRGVAPTLQHFCSMIDMIARAGRIEQAKELMRSMPFQADDTVWTVLLGASNVQDDVETGALAVNRVAEEMKHVNNKVLWKDLQSTDTLL